MQKLKKKIVLLYFLNFRTLLKTTLYKNYENLKIDKKIYNRVKYYNLKLFPSFFFFNFPLNISLLKSIKIKLLENKFYERETFILPSGNMLTMRKLLKLYC